MRQRSRAVARAIAAVIGLDELVLALALILVTVGLWPWLGLGALTAPGLVLLWQVLPSRAPFVTQLPQHENQRRRSS